MASDRTPRPRRPRAARLLLRASLLAALAAAPLVVAPPEARAQSAADRETARASMDEGDKKLAAGDHAGALAAYQAADVIMGVPTTKIEVGKAQEAMGLLVEARDTYYQVGRLPQQPKEPAAFARARADATARADALAARIPSLKLRVSGAPAGAAIEVKVDGALIPAAALAAARKVNPGPHTITVAVAGGATIRKDVSLKEAEVAEVSLDLAAPASGVGPVAGPAAAPVPAEPAAPPPRGRRWVLVGVGFGLAGVGVAAGAVTGAMSLSKATEAKALCSGTTCPTAAKPIIDKSMTLANVSNVGFVAGAAGVVLGIVGLVLPPKAPPATPTAVTVRPLLGAGFAGLEGEF